MQSNSQAKSQLLFEYFEVNYPGSRMTTTKAEKLLSSSESTAEVRYMFQYNDQMILITITGFGETIFVNGLEITGNLVSNTTYGDNSPIVSGVSVNVQSSTTESSSILGDYLFPVLAGLTVALIIALCSKLYMKQQVKKTDQ